MASYLPLACFRKGVIFVLVLLFNTLGPGKANTESYDRWRGQKRMLLVREERI